MYVTFPIFSLYTRWMGVIYLGAFHLPFVLKGLSLSLLFGIWGLHERRWQWNSAKYHFMVDVKDQYIKISFKKIIMCVIVK